VLVLSRPRAGRPAHPTRRRPRRTGARRASAAGPATPPTASPCGCSAGWGSAGSPTRACSSARPASRPCTRRGVRLSAGAPHGHRSSGHRTRWGRRPAPEPELTDEAARRDATAAHAPQGCL